MSVQVKNVSGVVDCYVGFSNSPTIELTTVVSYFQNATSDTKGVTYKLTTSDSVNSQDFKYMLLVQKGPKGGALLFSISDLTTKYGSGLTVAITKSISSTDGVYDNTATNNSVAFGSSPAAPLLYVQLPSYSITSNATGTVFDPKDYKIGDQDAKAAFAFGDSTHPLGPTTAPFIIKSKPGGWPFWVIFIVIVLLVVLVLLGVFGYKKYKKKSGYY